MNTKISGLLFIVPTTSGMTVKAQTENIDVDPSPVVVLTTLVALLRQQEWVSQTDIAGYCDMDVMINIPNLRLLVEKSGVIPGQPCQHPYF